MCWMLHVGWQELIKEKEKVADRAVRHAQCLATLKFIGELTKFRLAPPTVRQLAPRSMRHARTQPAKRDRFGRRGYCAVRTSEQRERSVRRS